MAPTVDIGGVTYTIVNPDDYTMHVGAGGGRSEALAWSIGAYGSIHLITLWHHMDDGLEEVGGWLADNAPGQLTGQDEMAELVEAAREELGPDAPDEEVWQAAEADLMYTESGWLPSWEVSARELHGEDLRRVLLVALEADEDVDEEDYLERRAELASANPSRGRGRGRMGRRNFHASEHRNLRGINLEASRTYKRAAEAHPTYRDFYLDRSREYQGRATAHTRAEEWPYEEARDAAAHARNLAGQALAGGGDAGASRNPGGGYYADARYGKWVKSPRRGEKWWGMVVNFPGVGLEEATVYAYSPRSNEPEVARMSRDAAETYIKHHGQKMPAGTKYVLEVVKRDPEGLRGHYDVYYAYTAHRTLAAAKAAGAKAIGATANRPRARANAPRSSGAVVLVKSSARARPVRVKLPAKAKPQKVGSVIVHRAVTYKGKKLRLLKGWTVSTSSGRGVGKYKTQRAALAAAKRAR